MEGLNTARHHRSADPSGESKTRVTGRTVVSEPSRVIRVEQVRVSDEQKSSVASAIRAGRCGDPYSSI
jgi:hypothetical protein